MTSSSNKLSDTNAVAYPTKPLVSKAMLAVVGLTILGLMIPAATFSCQLLREMGSAVMAVVWLSGAPGCRINSILTEGTDSVQHMIKLLGFDHDLAP